MKEKLANAINSRSGLLYVAGGEGDQLARLQLCLNKVMILDYLKKV